MFSFKTLHYSYRLDIIEKLLCHHGYFVQVTFTVSKSCEILFNMFCLESQKFNNFEWNYDDIIAQI